MSPLATATLEWMTKLYENTGEEPRRIVLPLRAYETLAFELMKEPMVPDGDPISGMGNDGRIWFAACELVPDVQCPVAGCPLKVPHLHPKR